MSHSRPLIDPPEEDLPEPRADLVPPARLPLPLLALFALALLHAVRWAVGFSTLDLGSATLDWPPGTFNPCSPMTGAAFAVPAILGVIGMVWRRRWGPSLFALAWCALYVMNHASTWLFELAMRSFRGMDAKYLIGRELLAPGVWTALVLSYLCTGEVRRAAGASQQAPSGQELPTSRRLPLPLPLTLLAVYALVRAAASLMGVQDAAAEGGFGLLYERVASTPVWWRGLFINDILGALAGAWLLMRWRWARWVLLAWACGLAMFEGYMWLMIGIQAEPWALLPLWATWWGASVCAATGLFHISYLCSEAVRRCLA